MAIFSDDIFRIYFWLLVFGVMFGVLALFRKTRKIAASGFIYPSYLLGFLLWLNCAALVYRTWGWIILLISILFFGIGPLFSALIILIVKAAWLMTLALLGLLVLLIAARFFGFLLLASAEKEELEEFE